MPGPLGWLKLSPQRCPPPPPPQGMKMVLLIHSMYRSKPILYDRVYHTEYEMGPNWRLDPWDGSNCHPKDVPPPPQGMKMVLLIHSMYRSKPILYESVYHTEYEMGPNWRLDPWDGSNCHPKYAPPPPQGIKMVLLIHSMYRSKPILYERVYHTEYEMGPNWRLDPWDGSNCHPKIQLRHRNYMNYKEIQRCIWTVLQEKPIG